jgi:hypothetical protein
MRASAHVKEQIIITAAAPIVGMTARARGTPRIINRERTHTFRTNKKHKTPKISKFNE